MSGRTAGSNISIEGNQRSVWTSNVCLIHGLCTRGVASREACQARAVPVRGAAGILAGRGPDGARWARASHKGYRRQTSTSVHSSGDREGDWRPKYERCTEYVHTQSPTLCVSRRDRRNFPRRQILDAKITVTVQGVCGTPRPPGMRRRRVPKRACPPGASAAAVLLGDPNSALALRRTATASPSESKAVARGEPCAAASSHQRHRVGERDASWRGQAQSSDGRG